MTTVATGQNWVPKKGGISWRIVGLSPDGTVALSGPGPCRMMKHISVDELEVEWTLSLTVDVRRLEDQVRKNVVVVRR